MPNGPDAPPPPWLTSLTRNPVFWLFLLLIPAAAANLTYMAVQCASPQDTSSPESLTIHLALKVAAGGPLYSDFRVFPFIVTPYGPLLYEKLGLTARLFSWNAESLFLFGRILLLACALGIAVLLFFSATSETQAESSRAIAPLLFLSCAILYPWACTCRPDVMAAFLAFAGFLVYLKAGGRGWRFTSVLLFLAAFLAKQSAVAAPAALIFWNIINRRGREALRLACLWLAALFLAFVAMHVVTGGMSTLNIIGSNAAPMEARNVRLVGALFFQAAALPLILAAAGAAAQGWRSAGVSYLFVSLAWALFSSAKLGSNVNYFIEPLAAACLLAPSALEALRKNRSRVAGALIAGAAAVLLLPSLSYRINALETLKFDRDEQARSAVNSTRGLVLTDIPRLALAGRTPILIEPLPLSYLENAGRWNSAPLLDLMDKGGVSLVVLTSPVEQASTWQGLTRLPKSVLNKIREKYGLQMRLGDRFFYVPKGVEANP